MKLKDIFNNQKTLFIFMFVLVCLTANSQEQTRSKVTLGLDLTPFIYNGFSAKVGIIPKLYPRLAIELEVFSINIPESVINLNEANANNNWVEKVQPGIVLYADRKLSENKNSFWLGGGVAYLNHNAKNTIENNQYQQLEYLLRINYKWFPFVDKGFFLNPYCALAYRHKVSGDNGGYNLSQVLIIPSFYASWEL